jgi:hypothetical protein
MRCERLRYNSTSAGNHWPFWHLRLLGDVCQNAFDNPLDGLMNRDEDQMEWYVRHISHVPVPAPEWLPGIPEVFRPLYEIGKYFGEWLVFRGKTQAYDAPRLKSLGEAKEWCRKDWAKHREKYLVELDGERMSEGTTTWIRQPFCKSWQSSDNVYMLTPTKTGWSVEYKHKKIGWAKSLRKAQIKAGRHAKTLPKNRNS